MTAAEKIKDEGGDEFQPVTGLRPAPPWSILLYGVPGIGKSTFGTYAPSPLFLDLENGLGRVDCAKTPKRLTSYEDVLAWMRWFVKSPAYKTVVIDTVDELEKFLSARALASYNRDVRTPAKTIADIPYGRGGDLLVAEWRAFIDILEHVRNAGKNVLLIGHEQIVKFENPSDANYDFYTVNLHKKSAPVVTAKMDAVLFARFETILRDKDEKKGKGKAATTGERVLQTTQGASWIAKNRFGLDSEVPMDGQFFERFT